MTPDSPETERERPTDARDEAAPEEALPGATEPAPDAPVKDTPAESVPAAEKLADPAAAGKMATDPAASTEKTAEAAAPAPEGAQPAQPASKPAAAAKPAAERPARPAREVEPKEAPRNPPPPGSINETIAAVLPDVELKSYMVPSLPGEAVAVEVAPADVRALMTACRDDARLDLKYLRDLTGVDWQDEGLEVVYHLWSFTKQHHLTVKTRVGYDAPTVPSVSDIFPAANWHERETRDMFGINFEGHPNPVPILLPEDMTDHFPLRKENPLQEIEEWQGENLREGAGEDDE
jgi:NADH-quinone oxidoreductase subunit C